MMKRYWAIVKTQRYPVRFLVSRVLKHTGLWRLFTIRREGYQLRLHPSPVPLALWCEAGYDAQDVYSVCSVLQRGDTYVDVGANVGNLVVPAARKVGEEGLVYAFEPHPRTCSYLHENIRLNRLSNVVVFGAAVGNRNGYTRISDYRSDDQNTVVSTGGILVPEVRIDTLVQAPVTLMKVDVEGFEKFVLEGCEGILHQIRYIYFEAWDQHFCRHGYTFSDLRDFLSQFGFEVYTGIPLPRRYDQEDVAVCQNLWALRRQDYQQWYDILSGGGAY